LHSPPYKIPCKPIALGIQENQRADSKSEIPAEKFESRILFIWVGFKWEEVWKSMSEMLVQENWEREEKVLL
jgi:hypothetical protein